MSRANGKLLREKWEKNSKNGPKILPEMCLVDVRKFRRNGLLASCVLSVLESKGLANYFKISKASCLWIYEGKLKNKVAGWNRKNRNEIEKFEKMKI